MGLLIGIQIQALDFPKWATRGALLVGALSVPKENLQGFGSGSIISAGCEHSTMEGDWCSYEQSSQHFERAGYFSGLLGKVNPITRIRHINHELYSMMGDISDIKNGMQALRRIRRGESPRLVSNEFRYVPEHCITVAQCVLAEEEGWYSCIPASEVVTQDKPGLIEQCRGFVSGLLQDAQLVKGGVKALPRLFNKGAQYAARLGLS